MANREELEARGFRSVARTDEVTKDRPFLLQLGERQLALYLVDGSYHATDGVCPHAAGPLGAGDLEDFEVTCPLHGWRFDIRSGKCTNVENSDIEVIPLEIADDEIFLRFES